MRDIGCIAVPRGACLFQRIYAQTSKGQIRIAFLKSIEILPEERLHVFFKICGQHTL